LAPRPPRSPPFPYTTLFRSLTTTAGPGRSPARSGRGRWLRGPALDQAVPRGHGGVGDLVQLFPGGAVDGLNGQAVQHGGEEGAQDRKSTRLNSSHVKISYAV